ncbi:unnamed protein product, partial [Mesorhabditis belari]|uniref:Uncharacterized protein n=1 Tax=Mesorhabditis belari TaxID=2138241 RepID=A0AAF3ETN1_9BILA
MAEKEALPHSEPGPNSPKLDENHEGSSDDKDYDSDASTEIEVAEGMQDLMLDDEIVLGAFARQQPRPTFWDTFIESSVVKMSFLIGMDSVGSFTYLYMKYGASVKWPLIVQLLVLGLPVLLLELSLGQFTSLNPSSLYKRMVPAFGDMEM